MKKITIKKNYLRNGCLAFEFRYAISIAYPNDSGTSSSRMFAR